MSMYDEITLRMEKSKNGKFIVTRCWHEKPKGKDKDRGLSCGEFKEEKIVLDRLSPDLAKLFTTKNLNEQDVGSASKDAFEKAEKRALKSMKDEA